MKDFRYIDGVSSLVLDAEACIGCGNCTLVCPHRVFALEEGTARIRDFDACIECGACAVNCPAKAISVTPGVGCASYIISGWLRRGKNVSCGC